MGLGQAIQAITTFTIGLFSHHSADHNVKNPAELNTSGSNKVIVRYAEQNSSVAKKIKNNTYQVKVKAPKNYHPKKEMSEAEEEKILGIMKNYEKQLQVLKQKIIKGKITKEEGIKETDNIYNKYLDFLRQVNDKYKGLPDKIMKEITKLAKVASSIDEINSVKTKYKVNM